MATPNTPEPYFPPETINAFRKYGTYLIDSSSDKEPMKMPYGYNEYVESERRNGVQDGLEFSPDYKPNPSVSVLEPAPLAVAPLAVAPDQPATGGDFVQNTAQEFVNVAKQLFTTVIHNRGPKRYGKRWNASHYHPVHDNRPLRDDNRLTTDAERFGLRTDDRDSRTDNRTANRELREERAQVEGYNDARNANNKRGRDERDRRDIDRDMIDAYLRKHPDEFKAALERASGTKELERLGDLDLGSGGKDKGKQREGPAGGSRGGMDNRSWRTRKPDNDSDDEDAQGDLESELDGGNGGTNGG